MEPWYKVATPRKEVREGRSFNPDEFAIALEQVVAGTAPEDYRKPDQFFADRLAKVPKLAELGVDPYGAKFVMESDLATAGNGNHDLVSGPAGQRNRAPSNLSAAINDAFVRV